MEVACHSAMCTCKAGSMDKPCFKQSMREEERRENLPMLPIPSKVNILSLGNELLYSYALDHLPPSVYLRKTELTHCGVMFPSTSDMERGAVKSKVCSY